MATRAGRPTVTVKTTNAAHRLHVLQLGVTTVTQMRLRLIEPTGLPWGAFGQQTNTTGRLVNTVNRVMTKITKISNLRIHTVKYSEYSETSLISLSLKPFAFIFLKVAKAEDR